MRQHVVLDGSRHVVLGNLLTHLDLVVSEVVKDVSHLNVLQQVLGASLAPVVTVFQDHRSFEKSLLFRRDQHAGTGRSDRQSAVNTIRVQLNSVGAGGPGVVQSSQPQETN